MAFLDKVGETLAAKSRDVADKAKEMAEVNRLNGQIHTQKNKAEKIYAEIGKVVYEKREDWGQLDISGRTEELDSIQAEIQRLKEEILRVKGMRECVNCGTEVSRKATVCPKCGEIMEAEAAEEQKEEVSETNGERKSEEDNAYTGYGQASGTAKERVCPGCNKKVEEDMVFCPFCGVRL